MNGLLENTNDCRSKQRAIWHRDLHGLLSHQWRSGGGGRGGGGGHSQAGWKDVLYTKTRCPLTHDLQSDHGGRSCHTVDSLPTWHTDYTCHYFYTQWTCCKKWSLEWAVPAGTQLCTVFGCNDFCGSTAHAMPVSEGMKGQTDLQAQQTSHLVGSLAGERCLGLMKFLNKDRPEQHSHWSPEGKRSSGRMQPTFHLPNSGKICFQPNIVNVSRATLRKLLRGRANRVRAFPSATIPSWAKTETEDGQTWQII